MSHQTIKIGDRVEIEVKRGRNDERVFVSQVEDVTDDKYALIHMPISYGRLVKLPKNYKYDLLFFTETGLLRYSGGIEDYIEEDGFNFVNIKLEGNGEKIQRRDFFRFDCIIPFKFAVLDDEALEDETMFQGIIKDIGGGGIKFIANEEIDEKEILKCFIKLDDEYLVVLGEILQKYYFPKSNYRFQYRLAYTGILPTQQEQIIRFIFEEQKKLLQRIK